MEKEDSEPQKSDLPGSVDSGKLNSAGQTLRWSDVKITDPDEDQELLEKEEDVVKKTEIETFILLCCFKFIARKLYNIGTTMFM